MIQPFMRRALELRLGVVLAAFFSLTAGAHALTCTQTASVTLAGSLRSSNGLPLSNGTLTFAPSQQGFIAGCGVDLALNTTCATSTDGSVVGVHNPTVASIVTTSGSGSLPAGVYYSVIEWYDADGNVTLASPETVTTLSGTGGIVVNPPAGMPALATGMKVFISTATGTETLQGTTVGSASYVQSVALVSGSALAASNTTLCQQVANDSVWPTGTGYNVSLTTSNGASIPGYPMQWQLNGAGSTINLSNGLPYYHGIVYYPSPIVSQPANHGQQSISGPLALGGYNLTQIGRLGVGTATPGWGVDVEGAGINGAINAKVGYLINGLAGTSGQAPCSDGSYVDTFCSFVPLSTTFYYQTVQANAVDKTQRAKLNFSTDFTLSDSASPSRTNVALAPTGVSAGACNEPNSITLDANGRVSACSSAGGTTPVSRTCTGTVGTAPWSCYKIEADGTIFAWGVVAASTAGTNVTSGTITFPNTSGDAFTAAPSLTVSLGDTADAGNNAQSVYHTGISTSGATVQIRCAVNIGGSGCTQYTNAVPIHWQAIGNK